MPQLDTDELDVVAQAAALARLAENPDATLSDVLHTIVLSLCPVIRAEIADDLQDIADRLRSCGSGIDSTPARIYADAATIARKGP